MKQAAFRDGKASYNDIVWWPKGGGWKNQSPTPNVNTRYMYFFINTRQDGPVVVENPPRRPWRQLLRHHRRRVVCAAQRTLASRARVANTGPVPFLRRAVRQNGLCRRVEMATAESGRRILLKAITSGSKPACNFESNPNQSRDQLKGRPNKNAKQSIDVPTLNHPRRGRDTPRVVRAAPFCRASRCPSSMPWARVCVTTVHDNLTRIGNRRKTDPIPLC